MQDLHALLVEWELAQYPGKQCDSTKQLDSCVAKKQRSKTKAGQTAQVLRYLPYKDLN